MKETAIDYLEEWILNSAYVEKGRINISVKMFKYHVKKAKELENKSTIQDRIKIAEILHSMSYIQYGSHEDYKKWKDDNTNQNDIFGSETVAVNQQGIITLPENCGIVTSVVYDYYKNAQILEKNTDLSTIKLKFRKNDKPKFVTINWITPQNIDDYFKIR